MINRTWNAIKPAFLPLLLAMYPALFHYANNVVITLLPSLLRILVYCFLLAVIVYIAFLIFYKGQPVRASIAAFAFLIFFNGYGILYSYLLKLDILQVEHYSLLPLFVLTAVYISWLTAKLNISLLTRFSTGATLVLAGLILFNIIRIIPHEVEKERQTALAASAPTVNNSLSSQAY